MIIESLTRKDIQSLELLQPEGWNDIRKVFSAHITRPYFEAFIGKIDGQVVAVGHTIYCENSSWIGNIIVHNSYRNKGYGKIITRHLVKNIQARGIQNIFLLATDLGRPLYRSLGFIEKEKFLFYKFNSSEIKYGEHSVIRNIKESDIVEIYKMDKQATGENRSGILKYFLKTGRVFENVTGWIEGFYLPDLGDGLIIALNPHAGVILSKFRYLDGKKYIVLPKQNIDFLDLTGINVVALERKAYFMYLGNMKTWKPEMIYSRVGGYLG